MKDPYRNAYTKTIDGLRKATHEAIHDPLRFAVLMEALTIATDAGVDAMQEAGGDVTGMKDELDAIGRVVDGCVQSTWEGAS